jgi:NADH-quinone oxidoreductase subunit G
MVELLQKGNIPSVSLKEIESADAVLVLGEDIWNTAPVMALAVRQAVMKTAATQATQQTSLFAWHDAAIKELVQEEKGFLANITMLSSPLDAISAIVMHENPDNMARLGFAVAHLLNTGIPAVSGTTETEMLAAKHIAAALQQARRPVIITGSSCYNEGLIKAAFNIAQSLHTPENRLAFLLCSRNATVWVPL